MDSVHWAVAQQCWISIPWKLIVISMLLPYMPSLSLPFFSTWTLKWKWGVYYWINATPWMHEHLQDIWATCWISWSMPKNSGGLWRQAFSLCSIAYKNSTSNLWYHTEAVRGSWTRPARYYSLQVSLTCYYMWLPYKEISRYSCPNAYGFTCLTSKLRAHSCLY